MAQYQQIRVHEVGNVTVVRFVNSKILDEGQIQQFGDELFALVEKENRTTLLLNFQQIEFLSSAALGKLIKLDKKVKAAGGRLRLACIKRDIYEVFKITKLDQMFVIKETEADALATF
jgi:anti-sigma B factor antagonist